MAANPFRISGAPLLSWLFGLRTYQRLYERAQALALDSPFEARALTALGIDVQCTDDDLALVPSTGAVVIAGNHPHGLLDGLAMASAVRRVRPDVRILTNHLLSRIPELANVCFFVDPFGGPLAHARSLAGLRAAHLWLRRGGALIAFPSGEVAHRGGADGRRLDSSWLPTTSRLAVASGATIVPAFIEGGNSRAFYAAGKIHASLRTLLLPRELLRKRHSAVTIRFGASMPSNTATSVMREAVEHLANPRDPIATEVSQLPAAACLVESTSFQVFIASAREIPHVLREIGRLREATYRAIGEGTGRSMDLDRFDEDYLHLFCWDRTHNRIVGAYRIGQTDRIVADKGVAGLYTRTLFTYDERLIARLSPALELGRSFIRAEYQKNYNALLLLWKGIGRFVATHPRYRMLFGPVSISARYSDSSHQLLMAFLKQNHLDADLANLVEAIHPRAMDRNPAHPLPASIEEANRLVARMEGDGKGVPVLLRQYLKLKAKLIGFNVDPQFGDALDALMMVDLTAVDHGILDRYIGREEAAVFLAWHGRRQTADAA
jgi:putative hemolysin